jgi:excisionase family DNA binding protein
MSEYPVLVTAKQAAKLLNVSRSQIYILMKSGRLGSVHIGRSRRITKDQVLEFVMAT